MTASATGFRNAHGVAACFADVSLLAGARTPFGKFCGALSTVSPTDLGIHAARAAIAAAGVDAGAIDQTIVGPRLVVRGYSLRTTRISDHRLQLTELDFEIPPEKAPVGGSG